MQITTGHVVEMNYTLKDDDGVILDSSSDRGALSYIQGKENIIPGLESQLEGKKVGDKLNVTVAAKDGYGEVDQNMIIAFPKDQFEGQVENLEVGMQFQVGVGEDQVHVMSVIKIEDEQVILDGNHPLAGANLHFEVEIMGLRDATEDEMERGTLAPVSSCNTGCCD